MPRVDKAWRLRSSARNLSNATIRHASCPAKYKILITIFGKLFKFLNSERTVTTDYTDCLGRDYRGELASEDEAEGAQQARVIAEG